ncbi:MAG TPA: alpha/beta fold hydrolase, partial [Planctomycetota bacterium]|nr:alpha/beta fold hydrolase [Planctomycetota bacterium]
MTEPSVAVTRIELATGPAVRLAPVTSQARATALLAHGVTATKETLFRVGEALAASGFECVLVDFPGHGESRVAFRGDLGAVLVEGARALSGTARVDVIVGHSMGAGVAARTLDEGRVDAKLLLAFGSLASARDVETLHLEGKWDELHDAPAGAVVSRCSDHCIEPWDPVLVDAAVKKACDVTGKTPVSVSRWKLRLLGGVLVLAGTLILVFGATPERAAGGPFAAVALIAGLLLASPLWT